ncbi:ankyrin repeat domain-containing protein [Motilimonas eburnea]|uniref:ankyrin repeat domain-containing protein n=1 Tax=Motilimonas eburnea TaxID=1737488 RepID=UPI001E5A733D|nr:hypothetical protein [Motilimonas eburnea]MCE2570912.1 hypothetical protein [Motilimonas eburnea]
MRFKWVKKITLILCWVSLLGCASGQYLGAIRLDLDNAYSDKSAITLSRAAMRGDVKLINKMLASGVDVNVRGKGGETPLLWSLTALNKKGYQALLEAGADPNIQLTEYGESVMSVSSVVNDSDFLRLALAYGGDPNLRHGKNNIQITPIFDAVVATRLENVKILMAAGANLNLRNWKRETVADFAASSNQWQIVYMMLEAGVDYTGNSKLQNRPRIITALEQQNIVGESEKAYWRDKVIAFLRDRDVEVYPRDPLAPEE